MRAMENSDERKPSGFVIMTGPRRNPITAVELLAWLEKATQCEECGVKLPRDHSQEELQACVVKMQEKRDNAGS